MKILGFILLLIMLNTIFEEWVGDGGLSRGLIKWDCKGIIGIVMILLSKIVRF